MKLTNILALLLCLVTVMTLLVSCVEGKGDGKATDSHKETESGTKSPETTEQSDTAEQTTEKNETTAEIETEPPFVEDNLPDKNFNTDFKLYTWKYGLQYEFCDIYMLGGVDEQLYARQQHLKDKYGINIVRTQRDGRLDNKESFIKGIEVNKSETADKAYDAIGAYMMFSGSMAMKGLLSDISDKNIAPHIDLGKPWWPDDLLDNAKINGKLYGITGDITPMFLMTRDVVHVNLDLFEKYNPGVNIYDVVRNKEWTYDKVYELLINNSSIGDDITGFGIPDPTIGDALFYSSGMRLAGTSSDGKYAMRNPAEDKELSDIYSFIYKFQEDACYDITKSAASQFGDGKYVAVMEAFLITSRHKFRKAILPMPMYKTANGTVQDEYRSGVSIWTTVYSIPSYSPDNELSSFTLEALASFSYRRVMPALLEEEFSWRNENSKDNKDMVGIILDGSIFDTTCLLSAEFNYYELMRKPFLKFADASTYYNENVGKWDEKVNEINQKLG
jgi:hypothetical protein